MGVNLFSGESTGDPVGIPCDPECWSEQSKRSVAYIFKFAPAAYRDKAYLCWRCHAPDVYTAADQKHTYEVRKVNISQRRILCKACHLEWVTLEREARACQALWAAEKASLRIDPEFLRRWLVVVETLPEYGSRPDHANMLMLRRLVDSDETHPEPLSWPIDLPENENP